MNFGINYVCGIYINYEMQLKSEPDTGQSKGGETIRKR